MSATGGDEYTLAGAYVLDALDDDERARFEAFLATSPEAQAEVDSLREAAALLGSAAPETPPEGLKRSVLDRIDTVRQQPPIVASLDDARADRQRARDTADRTGGRRWVQALARGAAAVAAVIAVGLGVTVAQLNARLADLEESSDRVATIMAATDATSVAVDVADGGRISALVSPAQGTAVVVNHGLPQLEEDRMYALWTIVGDDMIPVGELEVGRAVAVDAEGLDGLGVSVEPRGPLSQPTTDPIGVLTV